MRVAVITPYHAEPDAYLEACHASVASQSFGCTHFMVSDGRPAPRVDGFDCQHIRLPRAHADYGCTPRGIGSISAIGQGFDAICYLDADNWVTDDHVEVHRRTAAPAHSSPRRGGSNVRRRERPLRRT